MLIKSLSIIYRTYFYISQLFLAPGDVFDEVPLVRVKQGLIKGIKENSTEGKDFYSYLSIPYAEPPNGNLRFKAPIPKASWEGILDGTKMPVSCLQTDFFEIITDDTKSVTINGREDCLQLNVFTTA
ncbi:Esterase SG1, partial [Armadillidium nasatum]